MWPIESQGCCTLEMVKIISIENPLGFSSSDCIINVLASPKSGNMAANMLRAKLLAAKALAAYNGYESTRNVNTPEKIKIVLEIRSATMSEPSPVMGLTRSRRRCSQ